MVAGCFAHPPPLCCVVSRRLGPVLVSVGCVQWDDPVDLQGRKAWRTGLAR